MSKTGTTSTQKPALENDEWEWLWAPYDEPTYQLVLESVGAGDIVLEIGAGDLRLARRLAGIARHVHAIEIQAGLLADAQQQSGPPVENLTILVGDARTLPYPEDVTVAVLLMRHCTHFPLYVARLKAVNCMRLITNARWRMGVECIDLWEPRTSFESLKVGWYACLCGSVGFKPGPIELIGEEMLDGQAEVLDCPACQGK